jgi:hypothetical protein
VSADLEQRYRRVLRLLPGWYRQQWEEDMVAALLDGWLTGDPETDAYIIKAAGPSWAEVASVARLAARLYLGGAGTPRRYAWGQAIRRAVLTVMLVQAVRGLDSLVETAWGLGRLRWLPAAPAGIVNGVPGGIWLAVWDVVDCAQIVVFAALVLGYYRTARLVAVPAIVPALVWLLKAQLAGNLPLPYGQWGFWVLLEAAPVLALAAFHRDAPPAARWPWLLALPAGYLLVAVPLLVVQVTGNSAWLPDFSGQCCLLVALGCLAHAPRAWSRRITCSGAWSLTLMLLAAVAGAYRIVSLNDYLHDPHLMRVSLAELLIVAAAAALVGPDAARAQATAHRAATVSAARMKSIQDTPFQLLPRPPYILASMLAAGLMLTAVTSLSPLGPDTGPQLHQLRSPIVLQALRIHQATTAGGCPAGDLTVPGGPPGPCYVKTGAPVTITTAAVSPVNITAITSSAPVPSGPPAAPPGQQLTPGPGQTAQYGFMVAVPAAEAPALTAVIAAGDAYNVGGGAFIISVAGQTWAFNSPSMQPGAHGQFAVMLPSREQALQLQRMLAASG